MTRRAAVIAAAALLAAAACGEESQVPASIQEVKQKHEARLMAVEGVVSVGIGHDENGRPAIVVGIDRERPESRRLPESLDGYAVRTEVIGTIRPR